MFTAFIVMLATILLFLAVYLFLIFPSTERHPDKNLLKGMMIAHRGLHDDEKPENGLSAFQNAVAHGYAIETDVHITRDGVPVVFHDDTLKRMCGVDGKVEDKTLSDLKGLRLGNSNKTVPTLQELLDVTAGQVPLMIEFKVVDGNAKALCEATNAVLVNYTGKYFIQSFYPDVLAWYKKNRPDVLRGQLSSGALKQTFAKRCVSALLLNFIGRPHFVSYDEQYRKTVGRRLCLRLGATSVGWTFRDLDRFDVNDYDAHIFEGVLPKNEK